MIEYKIVENHDLSELQKMVELYLSKGWKPQGGVSVTKICDNQDQYGNPKPPSFLYVQAVDYSCETL